MWGGGSGRPAAEHVRHGHAPLATPRSHNPQASCSPHQAPCVGPSPLSGASRGPAARTGPRPSQPGRCQQGVPRGRRKGRNGDPAAPPPARTGCTRPGEREQYMCMLGGGAQRAGGMSRESPAMQTASAAPPPHNLQQPRNQAPRSHSRLCVGRRAKTPPPAQCQRTPLLRACCCSVGDPPFHPPPRRLPCGRATKALPRLHLVVRKKRRPTCACCARRVMPC